MLPVNSLLTGRCVKFMTASGVTSALGLFGKMPTL